MVSTDIDIIQKREKIENNEKIEKIENNEKIKKNVLNITIKPPIDSLCIPRIIINDNITPSYIKKVFEKLLGEKSIGKIDLVKNMNEPKFYRVFIQINYWSLNEKVQHIRERLESGNQLKIVYEEPHFWRCSISRSSSLPMGRKMITFS